MIAIAVALATVPSVAGAVPPPPMQLPGRAAADETWLIGAKPGAAKLLHRFGAVHIVGNDYRVPAGRARALAAKLGHRLTYAEPNASRTFAQAVADDPLSPGSRWRDASIDRNLVPPPVTDTSPLLALVDAKADVSHPEFAGGHVSTLKGHRVQVGHGTETLGTAVAPQNGVGIVGAYPGARAVNVPLRANKIACSDSATGIRRAVKAGAAVINMSYGATRFCQTEYDALQFATHRGITLVAAGGNEKLDGNPNEFPASLPHVLTVGALTPDDKAAYFSNTSPALDLVAPGVGIIAPTPLKLDTEDGAKDGYEVVAGTSFSAPIVAAAATWLRTARPDLTVDQVAQAIRLSATDIAKKGYDTSTGYGKLNLANALAITPPAPDVLEPNEDFRFVDGRAFGKPAKPIWTGKQPAALNALLDYYEDPSDVYRVRVPAHHGMSVKVTPQFGNPDVAIWVGGSRTIASRKGYLKRSHHTTGTDRLHVRNHSGRTRTAYVVVYVPRSKTLDARYALSVTR